MHRVYPSYRSVRVGFQRRVPNKHDLTPFISTRVTGSGFMIILTSMIGSRTVVHFQVKIQFLTIVRPYQRCISKTDSKIAHWGPEDGPTRMNTNVAFFCETARIGADIPGVVVSSPMVEAVSPAFPRAASVFRRAGVHRYLLLKPDTHNHTPRH